MRYGKKPQPLKISNKSWHVLPSASSILGAISTMTSRSSRQADINGAMPEITCHSAPSTSILMRRADLISSFLRMEGKGAACTSQEAESSHRLAHCSINVVVPEGLWGWVKIL